MVEYMVFASANKSGKLYELYEAAERPAYARMMSDMKRRVELRQQCERAGGALRADTGGLFGLGRFRGKARRECTSTKGFIYGLPGPVMDKHGRIAYTREASYKILEGYNDHAHGRYPQLEDEILAQTSQKSEHIPIPSSCPH